MPRSKAKNLSTLFRCAVKTARDSSTPSSTTSSSPSTAVKSRSSVKSSLRKTDNAPLSTLALTLINDDPAQQISHQISSILSPQVQEFYYGLFEPEEANDDDDVENNSDSPFANVFSDSMSQQRKNLSRERKTKWVFKNTQKSHFDKLFSMCLEVVGSNSMFQMLCKLGRDTGLKEYDAFIMGCIETARSSKDERVQMEQVLEIYRVFQLMKERGFALEEESFGPFSFVSN